MSISIFIAGDVVPCMGNNNSFDNARNRIFSPLNQYINDADIAVANLEAPVIEGDTSPIKKSGPNLYTTASTVSELKNSGFNVLTLANNHFFDQGQKGVENTISACSSSKLKVVGGGRTFSEARTPQIIECKDSRVAIINACEHEFSIADSEHGGSNPLDLINMQEDIQKIRQEADYVILILHGGVEHYQYPTPRMKRWYRHFVDLGADAVVNHHQHCMCGYEVYKGKPIFYGLGNFYFPPHNGMKANDKWYHGYAVNLFLSDTVNFELIPYRQDTNGIVLQDKASFEKEMERLNIPVSNDFLLQQKFDEYIIDNEKSIKSRILPSFMHGRIISALIRRGFLGNLYTGEPNFLIKNTFTCESHSEVIQRLFSILTR